MNVPKRLLTTLLLITFLIAISACTPVGRLAQSLPAEPSSPTETDVSTSDEPSPTITPTATLKPIPTATPTPNEPPAATATVTATPTPNEEASWIQCNGLDVTITDGRYFTINELAVCRIVLREGEFIVGTADQFQNNVGKEPEGTPCTAFLIKGPTEQEITIWYGGGDFYPATSLYTDTFVENKLQSKIDELNNHSDCLPRADGQIDIQRLP